MEESTVLVDTKNGKLRGIVQDDGIRIFKGVPYAQPPIGNLRFKRPLPPNNWEGERDATKFGNIPPQRKCDIEMLSKEFFENREIPKGSEDCLYLNLWCPPLREDEKYPVYLWIHGGAYDVGFSYETEIDGTKYAEKGVIFISIDYRINVFGFLTHPMLEQDGVKSGNYGIFDMIQSLKWVQENIEAFGGDKNNVTIGGESAGAMATQILLESPLADGLFHKVIQQSGGGFMDFPILNKTRDDVVKKSGEILNKLGVKTYEELSAKSTDEVMAALDGFPSFALAPYIDGELTDGKLHERIHSKRYKDVPIIIGSLSKELGMGSSRFFFYHMALNQCRAQLENKFTPAFMYYGDFNPPGDDNIGAYHALDLWYTFGTLDRSHRPMTEKDRKLSDLFISYWTNFIKKGNPNGEGLPEWVQYLYDSKMHLKLCDEGAYMEGARWF